MAGHITEVFVLSVIVQTATAPMEYVKIALPKCRYCATNAAHITHRMKCADQSAKYVMNGNATEKWKRWIVFGVLNIDKSQPKPA